MPVICLNQWKAATPSGSQLVQQKTATAADGSAGVTATFDVPLTAGNSVIAFVSEIDGVGTDGGPVLVGGGAESLDLDISSSTTGAQVYIFHVHDIAGGETAITVFADGLPVRLSICAIEVSGLANSVAEDTDIASALASATVTTPSVTPTSTNNLVVAVGGWTSNNYSTGPTNGFTRLTPTGGGAAWQEAAYIIQAAATAKSTGWGLTVGINWASAVCAFGGT